MISDRSLATGPTPARRHEPTISILHAAVNRTRVGSMPGAMRSCGRSIASRLRWRVTAREGAHVGRRM